MGSVSSKMRASICHCLLIGKQATAENPLPRATRTRVCEGYGKYFFSTWHTSKLGLQLWLKPTSRQAQSLQSSICCRPLCAQTKPPAGITTNSHCQNSSTVPVLEPVPGSRFTATPHLLLSNSSSAQGKGKVRTKLGSSNLLHEASFTVTHWYGMVW